MCTLLEPMAQRMNRKIIEPDRAVGRRTFPLSPGGEMPSCKKKKKGGAGEENESLF